ncbi:MAG: 2-amino-4-hydroxy-6-hydroxymethyldihydropteridine diphosphokinase [Ignavibacteriaceae bacterium]
MNNRRGQGYRNESQGRIRKEPIIPEKKLTSVYIGIGSNLGERFEQIFRAIKFLAFSRDTLLAEISKIYETKAWGVTEQPDFLNCVVKIETYLTKLETFLQLKEIETLLNRQKREKWREREIDLDILFYGDDILNSEFLVIPHRSMMERDFVVIPLLEIEPDIVHPVHKKKVSELWNKSDKTFILGVHDYQILLENGELKKVGKGD